MYAVCDKAGKPNLHTVRESKTGAINAFVAKRNYGEIKPTIAERRRWIDEIGHKVMAYDLSAKHCAKKKETS